MRHDTGLETLLLCNFTIGPWLTVYSLPALSEDAQKIMHRMANAAVNLVTTNEEFLGSVEMLE